jgi:hypothetical protein
MLSHFDKKQHVLSENISVRSLINVCSAVVELLRVKCLLGRKVIQTNVVEGTEITYFVPGA